MQRATNEAPDRADRGFAGLRRPLLLLAAALLVPVVPFLFLGADLEARVREWLAAEWSPAERFLLIAGVLATDILLPVPSSAVCTWGGAILGFARGTLASWLGMSVGAIVGFGLARLLGRPFARRLATDADLARTERLLLRYGAAALIATRPVPVFAEACVLLVGVARLPWRRFLPAVLASNLVVSAVYAACGALAREQDTVVLAVLAAALAPLAGVATVRWKWRRRGG
jgi:uncharacterized membrane protein YdjX (TVP38/TMEM64 family)